jgi:hypothetical protein
VNFFGDCRTGYLQDDIEILHLGISTVGMGSINPRSASQRRIVPLKAAPGAVRDARLEHVLQAARNPAACLSGALAFRFGIFWPLRLKARKASADFINSLHSYKWLCSLAEGPRAPPLPACKCLRPKAWPLLGMTNRLAEVFKNHTSDPLQTFRGPVPTFSAFVGMSQ